MEAKVQKSVRKCAIIDNSQGVKAQILQAILAIQLQTNQMQRVKENKAKGKEIKLRSACSSLEGLVEIKVLVQKLMT